MLQTAIKKLFKLREHASRVRPGADEGFDAHEKPFLDHLDDLRQTLFKIIVTLTVSTIGGFVFHKQIFELVKLPAKSHLAEIAPGITLWEKLELITLGPTEFIMLMLKLSFYSGLIVTFPFTVYFLFQFLLPGLKQAEKKTIIPGVAVGFVLFLVGGGFAFFMTIPLALKYFYVFENERISNIDPVREALGKPIEEIALVGFDGQRIPPAGEAEATPPPNQAVESPGAEKPALTPALRSEIRDYLRESLTTAEGANFALRYDDTRDKLVLVSAKGGKSSYQAGKYISFIAQLVLVFGVSFQMPIVVTILVKLELLTARVMRSTRSYAWIIIMVVAAILTPSPDALTMGLLGVPLIVLYEACIIIAIIMERRRKKRELAEEAAEKTRLEHLYLKPAADLSEEEKAEMHRAEIEQYEKEHAHLYLEDSNHVARESLHGDEASDSGTQHDESWHADDHYWHDGHHDDPHAGMESDHAEPENLTPDSDEAKAESQSESPRDYESCVPDGPVVDLNHATLEELMTLPGVGPKMADILVKNRPYETFDDLDRVPGLGPEKIRRITDRVMLG